MVVAGAAAVADPERHDRKRSSSSPTSTKVYQTGDVKVHALAGVSLSIARGEFVAIMGSSGSGKSTLMNILGCLDKPSAGNYRLHGREVSHMNKNELSEVRNNTLGFVFQNFNLLSRTTALENVELPLIYQGVKSKERAKRAYEALDKVGLAKRADHTPNQLSGGASNNAWRSRARWSESRASSSPTSPPAIWIRAPASRSWRFSKSSENPESPSCSSRTSPTSPNSPRA